MYETHKLDTQTHVFFYEQDFYVLSNFSSFAIEWEGKLFPTAEHVYHYEKFKGQQGVQQAIINARSAHAAFTLAQEAKALRRPDWDDVKNAVMYKILVSKVEQHEYVRRKLMATGDRELIEDSWRDSYWGWGSHKNGSNVLGRLWMHIRFNLQNGLPL